MARILLLSFLTCLFFSCKNKPVSQEAGQTTPPSSFLLSEAEQTEVIDTMSEVGIEMDNETLEDVVDGGDIEVDVLADKGLTSEKVETLISRLRDKASLSTEKIDALYEKLRAAVEKSNSGKGIGARGGNEEKGNTDTEGGEDAGEEGAEDEEDLSDGMDEEAEEAKGKKDETDETNPGKGKTKE